MTEEEINALSDKMAKKIERLVAAGIKTRTVLAVEIKYMLKDFQSDKRQKEAGHAQGEDIK